ncbi:MAG: VCBS repeat-containing protein [Planctomycetes bacterium]|nr:VCBS repeat-containing protein [Planctomycetota bacterium]
MKIILEAVRVVGVARGRSVKYRVPQMLILLLAILGACRRSGPPAETQAAKLWLTEITAEVGLDFVHESGARGELLFPEIMIGGVALFDSDGDGDLDIYLTNGHRAFPEHDVDPGTTNKLYVQGPGGKFVDFTAESGLGDAGYGIGVAIGDVDNDGDADVFVGNLGPDRLYRNRGDGTFEDVTSTSGMVIDGWSASACFFDYDADGFLDLYVTRYVDWRRGKKCFAPDGRRTYCGPNGFRPLHDVLMRNNGDGTFTDVSEQAGMASVAAPGLGVVCQDLNGDGRPDIYVANDQSANHLWINQGDGTFREEALEFGLAYNTSGAPEAGMGIVAADFDNDQDTDLFLTHLAEETNTFYRNLGGAIGFSDATGETGLGWSSVPYTGFGVVAVDL